MTTPTATARQTVARVSRALRETRAPSMGWGDHGTGRVPGHNPSWGPNRVLQGGKGWGGGPGTSTPQPGRHKHLVKHGLGQRMLCSPSLPTPSPEEVL